MEPPIFSIKDDFKSYLDEHGYVVIGDIMKENNLIDKFWSAWTQCSPKFKRDDMSTWTIENSPMMFAKGMAVFSGLAHSDFMWDVRLNKNIRKIFAIPKLWRIFVKKILMLVMQVWLKKFLTLRFLKKCKLAIGNNVL